MTLRHPVSRWTDARKRTVWVVIAAAIVAVAVIMARQNTSAFGNPNPLAPHTSRGAAIFDIAVLVLREGLECILVLAAITAGLTGEQQRYRQPIAVGAALGVTGTLVSWFVAVRILDDISQKVSALQLQAATGLLAVIVLLIVMNWFFHKMYWTGMDFPP